MIDDKELEKNIPLVKYIIAKTFSGAMTEILRFDVLEKSDSVQWAAEDVETPADLAVRKVIRERIRDCIDRLPALQAYVVRHVFGIGCEMQSDRKIGSRLGVSGQYINQVRHKALEALSADPQIKDYWESI